MTRRIRFLWDRVACPKCGEFLTMREIPYAYLPTEMDYFFAGTGKACPPIPTFPAKPVGIECEPEVGCLECNWQGSKDELQRLWINFMGDNPLRDAKYNIADLGSGLWVRYQRTLFNSFMHDWGGTAGYKHGVDFHSQIHCALCCCQPTEDFGCKSPAAGSFTVSVGGGRTEWDEWCLASGNFHLRDHRRHLKSDRKCHLPAISSE